MKSSANKFIAIILSLIILCGPLSRPAHATDFGAAAIAILKLVGISIKELAELKKILDTGKDTLRIINDVNRGIHDAVHLAKNLEDNTYIKSLFVDPIRMIPKQEIGQRYYEAQGQVNLTRLVRFTSTVLGVPNGNRTRVPTVKG